MRSAKNPNPGRGDTDLRMLWYPYTAGHGITPAQVDEAMRRGRRERAQMAAGLLAALCRLPARWGKALRAANALVQERRAAAILARHGVPRAPAAAKATPGARPGEPAAVLRAPEPAAGHAVKQPADRRLAA